MEINDEVNTQRTKTIRGGGLMSDYPYNLTAIATHLRELAQSIAKKLDISEQDAWDLCIEKLEYKYSYMTREDNNDSMS